MMFDGLDVPVYYDSLLGKLIVWAETRELAVLRMQRALSDLIVAGVQTNAPFHQALMHHPDFRSGDFYTGWLEAEFRMPALDEDDPRERQALIAAGIVAGLVGAATVDGTAGAATSASRWQRAARSRAVGLRVEGGGARGWRRGIASR
jgi:acetyl/propionyl-CoA carboxylase alpha subunit